MDAHITIVGCLTRDIEKVETSTTGKKYVHFSVAVSTSRKDAEGKYIPNYYECTAWESNAERVFNQCQKGTSVTVIGRFRHEEFENKNKEKRCRLVIDATDVAIGNRKKPLNKEPDEATEEQTVGF